MRAEVLMMLVVTGGLVLPAASLADTKYETCIAASDGTNAGWGTCGTEWIDREDWRLNKAWSLLTPLLEPDTKKALLEEQRAWIAFKETSCLFYADGTFGREGMVLTYPRCRAEIIAQRAKELRAIAETVAPR